jgi:hypothetical protein
LTLTFAARRARRAIYHPDETSRAASIPDETCIQEPTVIEWDI